VIGREAPFARLGPPVDPCPGRAEEDRPIDLNAAVAPYVGAAIVGLGIAGRAEALPILLRGARSPDTATRLVAVSSLAGFEGREALAALAAAASDQEEAVRLSAIGYLAGREGVERRYWANEGGKWVKKG